MQTYKEEIETKAKAVKTKEDLDNLLSEITSKDHDYDSIVRACWAAMLGAFNYVNRSSVGGVTGFQAGFIGWSAIMEFMSIKKDSPVRIVQYDNMLYPQYREEFNKTISQETWEYLQKEARKNLEKNTSARPRVIEHWQSVVDGKVPFGYEVR